MKRIMTMAAIGIIAIGFGTATLNAAETGTKIIKNGLKEGLKNGTKNGMKNGMKNGKKNGDKK